MGKKGELLLSRTSWGHIAEVAILAPMDTHRQVSPPDERC
jgi:hypothetical protein